MSRWDKPRFGDSRFAEPRFQSRWGGERQASGQSSGLSAVLYDQALFTAVGALNNFTLVVRIRMDDVSSPSAPAFPVTGFKLRVQGTVESVYLGVAAGTGNGYDAASLVQANFGGATSLSQPNTETTLSDLIALPWNAIDPLLISMYTGAVNAVTTRSISSINYANLFFLSGADEANDAVKSAGYSSNNGALYYIPSITAFG